MGRETNRNSEKRAKDLWNVLIRPNFEEALLGEVCRLYFRLKSPEHKIQCLELILKVCSAGENDGKTFPIIKWWMWAPQSVAALAAFIISIVQLLK